MTRKVRFQQLYGDPRAVEDVVAEVHYSHPAAAELTLNRVAAS
jgi:hypothetical protein